MLGIITGSGFSQVPGLQHATPFLVATPYGDASVVRGEWQDRPVATVARHGRDHSVAPHRINYRANLWALRRLGVTALMATAVSGAIAADLHPGDLVLIDQFLDFTQQRAGTYFDGAVPDAVHHDLPEPPPGAVAGDQQQLSAWAEGWSATINPVRHVELSTPYHPALGQLAREAAAEAGIALRPRGTYVCTNGPRFETPAEITAFARLGADLVGMTGCPEVALAAELELPYAAIGVISNPAAGLGPAITLEDILTTLDAARPALWTVLAAVAARWNPPS
ncbi:MAG: MTAP family purine nucleoside phosphorylase [Acidimicrobiales bacterium]